MNQLNFLQSLGWSLISTLWQVAVLWAVYKFITVFLFKKLRPAAKTTLAVTLTFVGFAWFLFTFIFSFFSHSSPSISENFTGVINNSNWNYFASQVLPWAAIAYLIVLLIPVWQFIRNYRFVQFIRTNGLNKIDIAWRLYVKNTASAMGIARKVNIWVSEWVNSPVTIGYLKPIILIPLAAINNLTPKQLEAVILHELSHIHRYDYFINIIISGIKTILYFNPFIKLLVKEIEREREFSCDEMVLQYQYKPGEYASALLRLEQSKIQRQMVMAASGKNHDLLHRVETILGMKNKGWNPLRQISFALLTMLGVVLLHAFISIKNNNEHFYGLSNEASPYYFLNGKKQVSKKPAIAEAKSVHENLAEKKSNPSEPEFEFTSYYSPEKIADPSFMNVSSFTPVIPELAPEVESQVKDVVDATRKIYRESEWKALEKSYADVLTSYEKNKVRSEFIEEANKTDKVDWKQLEDKLKLSYEQINWDKVGEQITSSLTQMKMDSIQCQLNINLKNLYDLEKLLKENNVTLIPDSEISLESIQENQQKAKEQLLKLRATRTKKIVKI